MANLQKTERHISPRFELAANLNNQVTLGVFVSAQALKRIRDEKLFVELGYESFKRYIDDATLLSKTQAYIYLKIADKFTPQLLENNNIESTLWTRDMGVAKLREMARLDDDDLKTLLDGEALALPGGENIDLVAIRDMMAKDVRRELERFRRESRGKISALEEDNRLLKGEKKDLQKLINQKDGRIAELLDIERLYGSKAVSTDDKRSSLSRARAALALATQWVDRIDLTDQDATAVQEQARELVRAFGVAAEGARFKFGFTIDTDGAVGPSEA